MAILLALLLLTGCGKSGPPYSQKEALKTFRLEPANLSAMPGDLEKQIDVQQMADLLEYMKTTH